MLGGWNSWKDRRGNSLDGPKEDWRPSVSTVKAVIKFAMDTEKLTHDIESETGGQSMSKGERWTTAQPEPHQQIN